jgi:hypothetical protein
MRISVDIDGVLANFVHKVREIADLPGDYEPPDWDFSDVLDKDGLKKVFAVVRETHNFWRNMPVYQENLYFLRDFLCRENGHEVYFVTSRAITKGLSVSKQTEEWLYHNRIRPYLNFQSIIAVDNAAKKREIIEALNIEVSVDDYGPTIEQCSTLPNHRAYLLDRPWNRDKDYGTRIYNLEQFFNLALGRKPADYYMV